ncbi:hypothetical protein TVAG_178830 [Trichomonas vaginalis G3]|uniref:Meckelin n=1 Tax=Trichomonas vaginalis (strain ATCC PRA-98 / G3) TaxID=412133 RepID=A2FR54_TRIV3|nr:Meckel-Gruber Syndrome (MKS)-like protein family [Trichomonas vaginalis G3]EAX92606.1 hypothetical protein TVAG_178830 [Trichomonas vaginalis G3]KAI5552691.1 Meckel-Gruber Syndrome (MKS)-like protein family [Trichomonas vaginalis G3]|eukprot:XP_001305536.1 hypothetical protein [Trichomonas vaginalis G3]
MIFFLIPLFKSLENFPVYPQPTCATNFSFNTYTYACQAKWINPASAVYNADTQEFSCSDSTYAVLFEDGDQVCKSVDDIDTTKYTEITFHKLYYNNDLISDFAAGDINTTYLSKLKINYAICKSVQLQPHRSCQVIANYYASVGYKETDKAYTTYTNLFNPSTKSGGLYGYSYWLRGIPWVSYPSSIGQVDDNDLISTTFEYKDVLTFILARYDEDGNFMGYKKMTDNFVYCGGNNNVTQIWRVIGSNYESKCSLNITEMNYQDNHYMYEPFFLDNNVLRPVPIMITGQSTNRPYRRFFITADYLLNNKIRYASSIKLTITLKDGSKDEILPPLFEINYTTVLSTTTSTHPFEFSTTYTETFTKFWRSVIIVSAVFGALAFAYFLFKAFTYVQHFGEDGIDGNVILGIFGEILHISGVLLFFIVFVFSFYLLCFFKWQKSLFMFLPDISDLKNLTIMQWVAFGCVAVSVIVKIIKTARTDVFLIDWETPREKGFPVSSWRRLMISNEWVRLFTIRSYSVPLTLIILLFILTGFKTNLMAMPIPYTLLVDLGIPYKILIFAYTSFLWLLFMLAQWIFNTFIRWGILRNPFCNFLDLCAMSNCSVIIMVSNSYGYYLHGRSVHVHADENMIALHNQLASEAEGSVGLRGLVSGTTDQVFEIYLTQGFRAAFRQTYDSVQSVVRPRALAGEKNITWASVSLEALQSYDHLNQFLQKFISDETNYEVRPAPFSQQALGIAPAVKDKSVFLVERDISFKNSMLAGIEWTLMIFYVLLFAGIESETNSPPIAAFVTFLVDLIIVKLTRNRGRSNAAKKSLIDNRFILS